MVWFKILKFSVESARNRFGTEFLVRNRRVVVKFGYQIMVKF